MPDNNEMRKDLTELVQAVLAYDAAIQSAANSPESMSSFCTAQGDTLDTLYATWLNKAQDCGEKYNLRLKK